MEVLQMLHVRRGISHVDADRQRIAPHGEAGNAAGTIPRDIAVERAKLRYVYARCRIAGMAILGGRARGRNARDTREQ
jgi:hypothetical protein